MPGGGGTLLGIIMLPLACIIIGGGGGGGPGMDGSLVMLLIRPFLKNELSNFVDSVTGGRLVSSADTEVSTISVSCPFKTPFK